MPDQLLLDQSKKFKLQEQWFCNTYAFLKWQQEIVNVLLHNLAYFQSEANSNSDTNTATDGTSGVPKNDFMTEVMLATKFELLTLIHSYLNQLVDYLVLFYCNFDESWNAIFCPLILEGIGTACNKVLFLDADDDDGSANNQTRTTTVTKAATATAPTIAGMQIATMEASGIGNVAVGDIEKAKLTILNAMKGVSLFKQSIYAAYSSNNQMQRSKSENEMKGDSKESELEQKDDMNTNNSNNNKNLNPFALTNEIRIKMNEMIDNIKTQLIIQQTQQINVNVNVNVNADGNVAESSSDDIDEDDDSSTNSFLAGLFESSGKKAKKNRTQNNATGNDWEPTAEDKAALILKQPNFVRLFVMRRVLNNYKGTVNKLVEQSNIDKATCISQAKYILNKLKSQGIGWFMKNGYNEKKQAVLIETIFNEVILKQLKEEYQNVATYSRVDISVVDSYYYQSRVFNATDIMCLIFQHLSDDDWDNKHVGDLSNCSLVCSQWLYHAFNPNCIHYYSLRKLGIETGKIEKNSNDSENNNSKSESKNANDNSNGAVIRMWQRLRCVKNLNFEFGSGNDEPLQVNQLLLSKLSTLRNVEIIENGASGFVNYAKPLQAVLRNCKDKIRIFRIELDTDIGYEMSPLVLKNATEILTDHVYFPIIWSNKLEKLTFLWVPDVGKIWCNTIINHCDCSGIQQLHIYNLTFHESMNANEESTQLLLHKLGSKFGIDNKNFNQLRITFYRKIDDCVLLFWKSLQPFIEKNNGHMELQVRKDMSKLQTNKVLTLIEEIKPKINKFELSIDATNRDKDITWMKKIISICGVKGNNSLEWFKINLPGKCLTTLNSIGLQSVSKLCFIEIHDWNHRKSETLREIGELMMWIMDKSDLGLELHTTVQCSNEKNLVADFSKFCKQTFLVSIEKQRPVIIYVQIKGLDKRDDDKNKCVERYSSYFDEKKVLKEYNEPKCSKIVNKYVTPKSKPVMSFKQDKAYDGEDMYTFRVANVERRGQVLSD